MLQTDTLSQTFVKAIDYFTEEYVKQLLQETGSGKLEWLKPYCNTISFPSYQFTSGKDNTPSLQFQSQVYIGYIDMLLPLLSVAPDGLPAYTKLTFNLDGVERVFVQVQGGNTKTSSGSTFADYVAALFPAANLEIPFNHAAIHVLHGIKIEGSAFTVDAAFHNSGYANGAHTTGYQFFMTCSGYNALVL